MKTILIITKLCLIITIILSATTPGKASHIMGMDLHYKSLGNHQYEVFLSFYRDCNGSNAPQAPIIDWVGSCGSGSIILQQISVTDITPTCNGISGSACSGGNGLYGIEEYVSSGILSLPANCNNVKISFSYCCRNYTITTLAANYGNKIYVETYLKNSNIENNAPVFTNVPVPFGCTNQPVIYNHGAVDTDGDQLHYSLADCSAKEGHSVNYQAGFSGSHPLVSATGIKIDSVSGAIHFVPTVAQVAILCVLVEEYRDGVKIGSVVRDIQFNVTYCGNSVPTLTGIDSSNQYYGTVTAGHQLCFDVYSNDLDAGQQTSISWNAALPAAQFFTSPSNQMATFCWQTNLADTGMHVFTVNVSDDYCPLKGQNTYTFSILVEKPVVPCDTVELEISSVQDIYCNQQDGRLVLTASGGTAPYNYQIINWSDGQFYDNQSGIFDNLNKGTYGIWVDDVQGCSPVIDTFLTIESATDSLNLVAISMDPKCHAAQNGAIIVQNIGAAVPYLYTLDGIHFQTSNHFTGLAAGLHTVTVIDTNGCSDTVMVHINEPGPVQVSTTSIIASDCNQSNGSITLSAQGGSGIYHYGLQGLPHAAQPTFSNLAAGHYTFEIIDANKCTADTTIQIPEIPAFDISIKKKDMPCFDRCEGAAIVSVPAYVGNPSYLWSNGATDAQIDMLCKDNYRVSVTDQQGCIVTETIKIERPKQLKTMIQSTSDESCLLNDGKATIQANGGISPYDFQLINQHNNQVFNNQTGIFNQLNLGGYQLIITDANHCSINHLHFVINGCQPIGQNTDGLGSMTNSLNISPNPASNNVAISWKASEDAVFVQIIDLYGRIHKELYIEDQNEVQFSVENLKSGSYFVLLNSEDGQTKDNQKLMVL